MTISGDVNGRYVVEESRPDGRLVLAPDWPSEGTSIDAIRELDSNQGFVAGTFQPASKVVWVQKSDGANCRLTFTAIPNGMTVVQDAGFGDCGFGNGVDASGTYRWMGEVGSKT